MMEAYHGAGRVRSPDATKRDPGPGRGGDHSPDPNAFRPGYELYLLADDVGGRVDVAPRPRKVVFRLAGVVFLLGIFIPPR